MLSESELEVRKLLDPMLYVFSGEDGGASFVKMRGILKEFYEEKNDNEMFAQVITMVQQFSRLCNECKNRNDKK
jgi:hypothetical protein